MSGYGRAVRHARLEGLTREDWLLERRKGLGGSDVPAILGLDRFRSPFEVYLDKIGELPLEESDSPALHWGNRLEGVIADEFADRHPEFWVGPPGHMYRHPHHAFMLSNPDRLIAPAGEKKAESLLEVKSSNLNEDWKDAPPDRVVVQVEHYLYVHDYARAHLAVLLHGRYYTEYVIERDPELDAILVEREAEFWQRVEDRKPPPVDGTESTTEALKKLYESHAPGTVADLTDAHEILVKWRDAKARKAELEREIAHQENELKVRLGTAEVGLYNGRPAVTWKSHKRKSLDGTLLRKEQPTVATAYEKETIVRRLLDKGEAA